MKRLEFPPGSIFLTYSPHLITSQKSGYSSDIFASPRGISSEQEVKETTSVKFEYHMLDDEPDTPIGRNPSNKKEASTVESLLVQVNSLKIKKI